MHNPFTWGLPALSILASISITSTPIVADSLAGRGTPSLPLPVTLVHAFEVGDWCENLAVRANGQILVSRLDTPVVLQVDPTGIVEPVTVFAWNTSEYRGALGISETTPDVFYVILSAFINSSFVRTSGVNSIFEIDMNSFAITNGTVTQNATVTKLVDIPSSDSLNGMTTLDDSNIFVGDVYNGWVYKVNTTNGSYSIAINDPNMKAPVGATTHLGVNGLKIHDFYLYWTNSAVGSLNRIQITADGTPVGNSSVVFANEAGTDDFVFKGDGTAFVALNSQNQLAALFEGSSTLVTVAGSNFSTALAGVTAGRFGRLPDDLNRLYVSTKGASTTPINGTILVGASVSYIDTTGL
ncbi:uncharacterized protein PAC_19531 [Phialocephala subalpina]|uniref:SMP-30/Gluconolactonase/LRE-like region domain-containing protein n=1 Tax=Phialocephala subalpina TaxID=576137 RepID=A0A1L7XX44_9HELO|nr:uncharacterized protein PAC_19531 [Phialocephala subalpina]